MKENSNDARAPFTEVAAQVQQDELDRAIAPPAKGHGTFPGLPKPRRYLAIAAISLGTLLTVIDGAIATVALPTIAQDLQVDSSAAVLVVTVYQLTLVMLLLPFSALGDLIGLKRMYQAGQALFAVATILCFFANTLPFLLVVRVLQSVGAAAALSVMSALIRQIYPARQLGRGLGVNSVVVSIAGALAPTAGGLILAVASWPWVFAAAAPFAILSLWLGRTSLPDVPPRAGRYNLAGAMLNMATFGLLIAGLEALVHGSSPVVSLAVVAIGVAFAVALVLHERREDAPILPVDLLARPVLALSTAGAFLAFIASMTLLLSLPFRLQHGFGLSPGEVGAMIAPWPLTTMIVAPTAGTLSDRYPAGLLGGIGMALATIGLILLAYLPASPDYWDVAWRMAFTGAGFGLYLSPNARLIVGSAPRTRAASAGGLISTTRLTGQTVGATLVAALLAAGFGTSSGPPLIAACLTMIAAGCSLARLRPSIREPKPGEAHAAEASARTEFHGA
jgi:MFS transporter, DHA2 family, multidrug resistance protein